MILINLLPHHEIARKKAHQAFNVALLVSAAVGAAIGGVIYMWYQGQIEIQSSYFAISRWKNGSFFLIFESFLIDI